ncbi:hypothetical protein DY000_02047693 [Brassica cretica]|uniref:F-box associated beta-propeller type 3 domain-containing protein n=1 Tax=Brassica cretica TaxID=69181 RepID=A0ABQ7F0G7_BRACR|nr:hypothetical protein DY000_02047693 [Brassica cretica]
MNRGGEISASIPNDLIIEIFSRLPEKSAARFRSYGIPCFTVERTLNVRTSQALSLTISPQAPGLHRSYFTELFLTRSQTRTRLLFVFELDTKFSFFSSPQLQNQNKKSSLVAPVGIYMMSLDFDGFTSGLIYFCSMYFSEKSGMGNSKPMIFNPSTQHYVSLPKPRRRSPQILGKLFRV